MSQQVSLYDLLKVILLFFLSMPSTVSLDTQVIPSVQNQNTIKYLFYIIVVIKLVQH